MNRYLPSKKNLLSSMCIYYQMPIIFCTVYRLSNRPCPFYCDDQSATFLLHQRDNWGAMTLSLKQSCDWSVRSWDIRAIHLVLNAYSEKTEHYETLHSSNVLVHKKSTFTDFMNTSFLGKVGEQSSILPGKVMLETVGFLSKPRSFFLHFFVSGHQYQHFFKV